MTHDAPQALARATLETCAALTASVLEPMKRMFIDKDEIVDLLGVGLIAGENLFIMGPPGTAKSAMVQELGRRVRGRTFDYLLTRFTEPNELFGPFDIRELKEGRLVTNKEGMLPEASLVFLDELLNANSAILNSLLTVLNERVFRRGRETIALPLVMVVGASNHLPEDDALAALLDRFLLRVESTNVPDEHLGAVLSSGWNMDVATADAPDAVDIEAIRGAQSVYGLVDFNPARHAYVELVHRIRHAGIPVSDRRAVKLQKVIAASALLSGRLDVRPSDFWVLRYIWNELEQQEVLRSLVQDAVAADAESPGAHPRARGGDRPDPESIARDLEAIDAQLRGNQVSEAHRSYLSDRIGLLAVRCEWLADANQREFLVKKIADLRERLDGEH